MCIEDLISLMSAAIATKIKGKSVEEIRDIFGITNDFSAEEERQIQEENRWLDEIF